ncbi:MULTISPECIES: hypothetical protein [unclassified Nocardia]|uniref:hypothetical protein n=1 Tax=unclassified Nocardia TaxID=2637762 RepID=UPI00278BC0D0|nr:MULTISPECIES: hypothetical protein [unclassified Nocardia]
MVEFRYICTNCLMGWHEVPYCPFRRSPPPSPATPGQMRAMRHIRELERQGILPDPNEVVFRWRWLAYILLGFAVFFLVLFLT